MKSKTIAKNTIFLFIRSIIVLVFTLYTSRVVLQTLGVVDFGIYNVVGGVATMFVFISSTLTNAIQRFMSFELGKGDLNRLNKVFICSVILQLIIACIILVLGETVGLWFLYNKLVIPENRFDAAFWTYQFSLFLCIVQITRIPYDAVIIAYERFSAYAYFSITNVVLRLLVALSLPFIAYDRLTIYALLILSIGLIINLCYRIYVKHNFKNIEFRWIYSRNLFKEMLSFSGWTFLGNIAWMGYTQGLDIVLNMFAGPVGNASSAIAKQVQSAVATLSSNVQTAINPQIIKSYSINDLESMHKLMLASTKYSFYLVWMLVLPLSIESDFILKLWLGNVPEYAVIFTQMILVLSLLNTLSRPLMTSIHATGNIKKIQIIESAILILIIPFAYSALKIGLPFYFIYIVYICIELIAQCARILVILPIIKMSIVKYLGVVFNRMFLVIIIPLIFSVLLSKNIENGWYQLFVVSFLSVATNLLFIALFGMDYTERQTVYSYIKRRFK